MRRGVMSDERTVDHQLRAAAADSADRPAVLFEDAVRPAPPSIERSGLRPVLRRRCRARLARRPLMPEAFEHGRPLNALVDNPGVPPRVRALRPLKQTPADRLQASGTTSWKARKAVSGRWCPGERSATARQALGGARTDRWSRRCFRSSAAPRARWLSMGRRRPARCGRP